MSKVAISVTLAEDNLLWLKARTRRQGKRSISAVLDDVVREARKTSGEVTSVVGWVTFPQGEDGLEQGDEEIRDLFERSLSRSQTRPRKRRG